jgi:hypothetical protein
LRRAPKRWHKRALEGAHALQRRGADVLGVVPCALDTGTEPMRRLSGELVFLAL